MSNEYPVMVAAEHFGRLEEQQPEQSLADWIFGEETDEHSIRI